MPSSLPLPTIDDFAKAFGDAVRGERDVLASTRRGGGYDLVGGSSALIWSREAYRDRHLFRQAYRTKATGDRLDAILELAYDVSRIGATYGEGTLVLKRPDAGGGAGTIYTGTRIEVLPGPMVYVVSEDTDVGASDLGVKVPVRSSKRGKGTAASVTDTTRLRLADIIFDDALTPVSLVCAEGTERESDPDYLRRAKGDQRARRVGYPAAVEQACRDAGAGQVVIFDAGAFGEDADFGVTHVYVADQNFQTTDDLKEACFLALEAKRVEGCDLQVLGMTQQALTVSAAVALTGPLASFNLPTLRFAIRRAMVDQFSTRAQFWLFREAALIGAAFDAAGDAIRSISLTTTPSEPAAGFVPELTRYTLAEGDIAITFTAP